MTTIQTNIERIGATHATAQLTASRASDARCHHRAAAESRARRVGLHGAGRRTDAADARDRACARRSTVHATNVRRMWRARAQPPRRTA